MKAFFKSLMFFSLFLIVIASIAQPSTSGRERLLMDFGWNFAFGHPSDAKKDFNNGTAYFSYLAKAAYGADGPADPNFDVRSWRKLDLPHDWAAEAPFDSKGSHSHGYKAIGRNFPEASVGWYRKSFFVPESDLGRKITLEFDGVSRNSIVWVNGFYLGTEISGYSSFQYDITDYLNYGGDNVIAVRTDVTIEEGWFYEGAGIYRHVWLSKTAPLHVAKYGTFVTTEIKENAAGVTSRTTIVNESNTSSVFDVIQKIVDADGKIIATAEIKQKELKPLEKQEYASTMNVSAPKLWSLESPYLHKLITLIQQNGKIIDQYETMFGIRSIRFDADKGFFLNGKHVKLKGTNNHQDHAGVGTAMPDALQYFRIATLKAMGSNAYRCSHNPPTPELLDACDRLGMLVIDENRLMGITTEIFDQVKGMIIRDRNHPSIIAWSIGNEEWGIEGNIKGARIASTMQDYVKTIDTTRPVNAAISGGWGGGISTVIEVMGYNYLSHGSTDEHHKKFPLQPSMGTEEGSTHATRGVYEDDKKLQYISAYDRKPSEDFFSIEAGWTHYAERDYLAGMFIWTGFDYRGESTPYTWPSVSSYFGMLDMCGFPKDNVYYLRSWWTDQPVLHILPHWNWKGKEGQERDVWVYSNCDEVELFLNKKSLGKKVMKKNSHLEWKVKYVPGTLEAVGYKNGKKTMSDVVKTTDAPAGIELIADRTGINADKEDISVITVKVNDKNNLFVPTAGNEITFSLQGPGKIIGVGNGDPTSHEQDRFIETISALKIDGLKEKEVDGMENRPETGAGFDDSAWRPAFQDANEQSRKEAKAVVFRGSFDMPQKFDGTQITFMYKSIGTLQSIYVNGKEIAKNIKNENPGNAFKIDLSLLKPGKNNVTIVTVPFVKKHRWDNVNTDPGVIQIITPPSPWNRKLFNGLAQVMVQSTSEAGEITLTATSPGLKPAVLKIQSKLGKMRDTTEQGK
jgi:beta-galactosidase